MANGNKVDQVVQDSRWSNIGRLVLPALVAAIAAAGSVWVAFIQVAPKTDQLLLERIQHLEIVTNELQDEISSLRAENAVLQLRLEVGFSEAPEATVAAFLDALPRPAWCKYYDPEEITFRGLHFNPRYEFEYRVSNERYKHSTDEEIWGPELGALYYANDLVAYHDRGAVIFTEPVQIRSGSGEREFWKFYLGLHTGLDLVCGIQVTK